MLAIRMQRTGRKGHAQFRIIVQDARRTPTSGAIVAQLGYYNPHDKQTVLDKERTDFYLGHGAQPSDRVMLLLKQQGVKLPTWVVAAPAKSRTARHPEKLRKNQPAAAEQAPEVAGAAEPAEDAATDNAEPAETAAPDAETASAETESATEAAEPATDSAENKE